MIWMAVETVVAVAAGILAHSLVLTAFGADSVIELASAAIFLWRFAVETRGGDPERVEHAERIAAGAAGGLLLLLAGY